MTEIKKGNDAGDHAPKPKADEAETGKLDGGPAGAKQDAPNYDSAKGRSGSVPVEDMNSANDE